jgi:hypothetical protein
MDRIFKAKLATSEEASENVTDADIATEIIWHRESDVLRWIAASRSLERNSSSTHANSTNPDSTSPQFSIGN